MVSLNHFVILSILSESAQEDRRSAPVIPSVTGISRVMNDLPRLEKLGGSASLGMTIEEMRKKIIAANWKMNMTQGESAQFVESFLRDVGEINDVEVVIVPPFTAIAKVSEALGRAHNIKLGAQNMYWEKSGAFTGEISAPLLRDLFVHYVVLGHSERRTLFGETDEMVNRKVRAAHEGKLRPIVCVGETLEQRDKGNVEKILSLQLRGSLAGLSPKELQETVIAYEPVWAIGTGRNATPAASTGSARVHPTYPARNDR